MAVDVGKLGRHSLERLTESRLRPQRWRLRWVWTRTCRGGGTNESKFSYIRFSRGCSQRRTVEPNSAHLVAGGAAKHNRTALFHPRLLRFALLTGHHAIRWRHKPSGSVLPGFKTGGRGFESCRTCQIR